MAGKDRSPWEQYDYKVFISYSHDDMAEAEALEQRLLEFRTPRSLRGDWTPVGPVPKDLRRIFRDRTGLGAASDLSEGLKTNIVDAATLVVVCSPAAAKSDWVNREIEHFRATGREKRVFAYIVGGEPEQDHQSCCFPPAFRDAPPIAADARPTSQGGDGPEMAYLKLIAGILSVSPLDLKAQEAETLRRRARRSVQVAMTMTLLALVSIAVGAWATLATIRLQVTLEEQQKFIAALADYNEQTLAAIPGAMGASRELTTLLSSYSGGESIIEQAMVVISPKSDRLDEVGNSETLLAQALETRTIEDIERAALANDGTSLYLLAFATHEGLAGVERDVDEAIRLARRSASLGVSRGANLLGFIYCCSDEAYRNEQESAAWFKYAADLGLPIAMRNLGINYRDGSGVERNIDLAEDYLLKAAEAGNDGAWDNLVGLYSSAAYGRLDRARAQDYRLRGYNAGYIGMASSIGDAYRYGTTGETEERNPQRALEHYLEGAERGCAECWGQAASLFRDGDFGEPDLAAAYRYYERGAAAGHVESMLEAARALAGGKGVPEDDAAAFGFFELAAAQDNLEAKGSIGVALARGEGVAQEPERAAEMLRAVLANDLSPDPAVRHLVYDPFYWSYADALADLLEAELTPEAAPGEAAQLRARYGERDDGMKRFTVPITCGGARTPFHVYIVNWDRPDDETIEGQAGWLSEMRGCDFPADVLESFRKLKQIARENNVSFVDLAVYALGAAQAEQAQGRGEESESDAAADGAADASPADDAGVTDAVAREDETATWSTAAFSEQPQTGPVRIDDALLAEEVVILLQGRNVEGEQIYTYLRLSLARLQALRDVMRAGEDFDPTAYGEVLAAGSGVPSEELVEQMAREHNMIDVPRPTPSEPVDSEPSPEGSDPP